MAKKDKTNDNLNPDDEIKQDKLIKQENQSAELQNVQPLTKDIIRQHNELIEYVVREEMIDGIHYGIIPGTKEKILFKPGGDLLKRIFNLIDVYELQITAEGNLHKTYEYDCRLLKIGSENVFAFGTGSCSTLETKYRYHWVYQDGKKHHQEEIPEEKRPDLYNTIKKMAKKRAMLDAVNSFFSPKGFFPGDKTDARYQNRIVFEWDPTREDLNDPDWYIEQINNARMKAEITKFLDEFKMDMRFFGEPDIKKINGAVTEKWKGLEK